jgi:hypothetical protein
LNHASDDAHRKLLRSVVKSDKWNDEPTFPGIEPDRYDLRRIVAVSFSRAHWMNQRSPPQVGGLVGLRRDLSDHFDFVAPAQSGDQFVRMELAPSDGRPVDR